MLSADRGVGYCCPNSTKIATETSAGTPLRLLTAFGQRDTHALTLEDGRPNRSPKAGRPYQSISWDEIRRLVDEPAARPKEQAQFAIFSTYVEHDGRTHQSQRERGEYWGLAVDIDEGHHPLPVVEAAVRTVAPGASAVIYSSSSATLAEPKWRVVLELARPISGADYKDTQEALFDLFKAQKIICCPSLGRAAQPIFLPNVPPNKRGPDGRPIFYQSLHIAGQSLDLSPGSLLIEAREARRAKLAADAVERNVKAAAAREARRAYVEDTADTFDPVEHFNATAPIAEVMRRYGFEEHPRKKGNWKSPLSGTGSFSTRIFPATEEHDEHWVAVSAWAKTHKVGNESRNGYRFGDSFDLFTHFEHEGDRRVAILAHVKAVRPDLFAALDTDPSRLEAFLTWAVQRRRHASAIERFPDRGPPRNIDDVRDEIAIALNDAIRRPGVVHLFRPATGTGKTTLALEAAAVTSRAEAAYSAARKEKGEAIFPQDFAMSLPTHANVREVEQAAIRLGLSVAAYPERNKDNCGHIEKAARAAGMGLNIFKAVCESCPGATTCKENGYLAAAKKANASAFRIGTHDRAVVAPKMTEKAEAIFLDEDLAKVFAPIYSADTEDVRAVLFWARGISNDLRIDGGRLVEADDDQRIFANALADVAGRIVNAADGVKEVDVALPPEQKAVARVKKAAALRLRRADHKSAELRLKETRGKVTRIKKRLKKTAGDEQLTGVLKDQAAEATAMRKQRWKHARAAAAALKRIRNRPLTSFLAVPTTIEFSTYPAGRVHRINLPTEVQPPDNWSAMVYRWAERYGAGTAINSEARKIIMLAATGGLEALFVVQAAPRDNETTGGRYVFAKGKTAIPRDRPIIALDATADAEALRAMTGREVIDHTPAGHIPLVQDAIQFTADLTASTSPAEAANVVEAILERLPEKRRIGIIGWRKAISGLPEKLGPAAWKRIAKTAYFWEGPDRGSNDWIKPVEEGGAGCDLLVVLGTPRPGTEPVRKLLISMGRIDAAGLLDGDWGPRRWEGRRPDARTLIVESQGYRHPEWHRAYCMIVRSVLLQAIGRARASLPEGIPVVAVTIEPTGLPAADPLPILGTEVRETVDLAKNLVEAGKRNASYKSLIGSIALRGWVRTADLIAALASPDAVRKQSRSAAPGLSKRAAGIRIERAVAAGRLVRGPRGWLGIAGESGPWPASAAANRPEPAAGLLLTARPTASRPVCPVTHFELRPAAVKAAPPIPVLSPDLTRKEKTWSPMALTKTG